MRIPAGRPFPGNACDCPEVGPVLVPGERDKDVRGQSIVSETNDVGEEV